jgi:endonuclease III
LYPDKRRPEKETLRDLITKEVQLGKQNVDVGVTKNMERLQNYLSRIEIPEGQLQSGKPEYEKLIKKSGFSKNDFNRIITQLQLYYANPGEKRNLKIIPEVKKNINKFPSPRFNREILKKLLTY